MSPDPLTENDRLFARNQYAATNKFYDAIHATAQKHGETIARAFYMLMFRKGCAPHQPGCSPTLAVMVAREALGVQIEGCEPYKGYVYPWLRKPGEVCSYWDLGERSGSNAPYHALLNAGDPA